MNVEPYRQEQGKGHAASRQLLRTIRVTNNGWPVEIILVNRRAYLAISTALGGDGTPDYRKPHKTGESFQNGQKQLGHPGCAMTNPANQKNGQAKQNVLGIYTLCKGSAVEGKSAKNVCGFIRKYGKDTLGRNGPGFSPCFRPSPPSPVRASSVGVTNGRTGHECSHAAQ